MSPMFVPGPVDVADEVARAQAAPMLPHRSAEFEEIFHRAESGARRLFYTEHRVILSASSGTGLQETAVRNFVTDEGQILMCSNGAFGNRWVDVAGSNGKRADRLETEWDEPVTAERVAEKLKEHHYDLLCVVHNETSTGMMNPVQEIAAAARAASPDTLIAVDAVSSLSGAKIEMDAWGIDFLLTSSQKALALPPGLALAGVSDRAMARAESVPNRGWYFDLVRLEKHRVKDSTPATPAIGLIYALDLQLKRIFEEGLENRFARHSAMAARTQAWAEGRGFELFAPPGSRSQTVTTIRKAETFDVGALNRFLLQRGMRIAGGYGPIKPVTFRIAHMGELQLADMEALFEAIESFIDR
ncbi:MAG TPA: alanine--glyoxylate aminotransferase family protein [Anaerolineales bacterium]|nr:alanine--glyoxylate aminotransferase family protein [Anaerolineales bacterium]